jgi:hypothetical protein
MDKDKKEKTEALIKQSITKTEEIPLENSFHMGRYSQILQANTLAYFVAVLVKKKPVL